MGDLEKYTESTAVTSALEGYWSRVWGRESPRRYLGASIIGHDCLRYLWLSFRGFRAAPFPGRMLRLFERGRREEQMFIEELRGAGATVLDIDASTGHQWAVDFCGGHVRGHADGVACDIPGSGHAWHLLEFKTHSEKSFSELKKKGVKAAKPQHFVQMQIYMLGLQLNRALYLAVNKNTDELYAERIRFDKEAAESAIRRAHDVVSSNDPPERLSERPDFYKCKTCNFYSVCFPDATSPAYPPSACCDGHDCRTCRHCTADESSGNARWFCSRMGEGKPVAVMRPARCDTFEPFHDLLATTVPDDVHFSADELSYIPSNGMDAAANAKRVFGSGTIIADASRSN